VHVEKGTDAVASAVKVVHPVLPQRPTRKHLEHNAWSAGWEDGPGKGDVALKHARVRAFLVLGWELRAKVERARDVRRAVDVLPAGIAQVDAIDVDRFAGGVLCVIVNHGGVGAG